MAICRDATRNGVASLAFALARVCEVRLGRTARVVIIGVKWRVWETGRSSLGDPRQGLDQVAAEHVFAEVATS